MKRRSPLIFASLRKLGIVGRSKGGLSKQHCYNEQFSGMPSSAVCVASSYLCLSCLGTRWWIHSLQGICLANTHHFYPGSQTPRRLHKHRGGVNQLASLSRIHERQRGSRQQQRWWGLFHGNSEQPGKGQLHPPQVLPFPKLNRDFVLQTLKTPQ